jgi:hypothetical protein
MADYLSQIKRLVSRYDKQARRQIRMLSGKAQRQLPRRRQQLLKGVRRLRTMVNQQLNTLERQLKAAGPKKRRR